MKSYKLPNWAVIDNAFQSYLDDPNFKDDTNAYMKTRNEINSDVFGYSEHSHAVDKDLQKINVTSLDNMDTFKFEVMPSTESLKNRLEFYKKKEKLTPEEEERVRNLKTMHEISTDTAYIMPVYDPKLNRLSYMVTVSADLHNTLKEKGVTGSELAKATSFAVFHELSHFMRGDPNPWKFDRLKEKYKHLQPDDHNILEDTDINSNGLRVFKDTAAALLDKIGIRGTTVKKFLPKILLTQAVDDLKDELVKGVDKDNSKKLIDKFNEYIKDAGGEPLKGKAAADLLQKKDMIQKLAENLKKAGSAKELFKPESEKWSKELDTLKKNKAIPQGFNLPESYLDVANYWANNAVAYENSDAAVLQHDLWTEYYDRVMSVWPKQGGQKGPGPQYGEGEGPSQGQLPGKQPGGQDHWNDKEMDPGTIIEVPGDEMEDAIAKVAKKREDIRRKAEGILETGGRDPGTMFGERSVPLKPTKNKLMEEAIKRALIYAVRKPDVEISQTIIPVVNLPVDMAMQSIPGALPTARPKGILASQEVEKMKPRVAVMMFDESASVDDDMLAAAKTAVESICREKNLTVISLSGSAFALDKNMGDFISSQVYNPEKHKSEDFLKRFLSGGTDNPLDLIFNMDKLFEHKEFTEKLDKQLKDAGVNVTSKELKEQFEKGQLPMISVTDGYIPEARVKGEEDVNKLKKLAKSAEHTIGTIVTWNPIEKLFSSGINLSKSMIDKLVRVIRVGG